MQHTYFTALYALEHRAALQPGETVFVTGAAGGVGLAAVDFAHALGARVIAGVGSDDKRALVRQYGAEATINYRSENLRERIKALTGGKGVDVCFDNVGGAVFGEMTRLMNWGGRLMPIGFTSGEIPSVPMNLPLLKNYSIVGVFAGAWGEKFPQEAASRQRAADAVGGAGPPAPACQPRAAAGTGGRSDGLGDGPHRAGPRGAARPLRTDRKGVARSDRAAALSCAIRGSITRCRWAMSEIEDRAAVESALGNLKRGLGFADALHHASSRACEAFRTLDSNGFAAKARRMAVTPPVRLATPSRTNAGRRSLAASPASAAASVSQQRWRSHHSMTSVAWVLTDGGTVMRNARALRRLTSGSNSVGRSTARSAGFAPLKIRAMYSAERLGWPDQLTP